MDGTPSPSKAIRARTAKRLAAVESKLRLLLQERRVGDGSNAEVGFGVDARIL
jgi:hypothetical protein